MKNDMQDNQGLNIVKLNEFSCIYMCMYVYKGRIWVSWFTELKGL